jgi:hypothetical protein
LREAKLEVPINENGKQKVVKKIEVVAKQVMNKAATGSIQAQRILFKLLQQAQETAAEQEKNSPNTWNYPTARAEDLTDDQPAWISRNSPEYAALSDTDVKKADA